MTSFGPKIILLAIAIFCYTRLSSSEQTAAEYYANTPLQQYVDKLDQFNYDSYLSSTPAVFIEFFETGCSVCNSFRPIWANNSKIVNNDHQFPVRFAAVNCYLDDQMDRLPACDKYLNSSIIWGFPTVLFFQNGILAPNDTSGFMYDWCATQVFLQQEGYNGNDPNC